MKKLLMMTWCFYSFLGNAALTREEQRRVTEGAVINTLLPDSEEIRDHGISEVARHMLSAVRDPHVRAFTNRIFCNFVTRFLSFEGGPEFQSTAEEQRQISLLLDADLTENREADFLMYMLPVREEFRRHRPREGLFCAANYGLFFADLYTANHNINEDSPTFRLMIEYIQEQRESYPNHSIPIEAAPQVEPPSPTLLRMIELRVQNRRRMLELRAQTRFLMREEPTGYQVHFVERPLLPTLFPPRISLPLELPTIVPARMLSYSPVVSNLLPMPLLSVLELVPVSSRPRREAAVKARAKIKEIAEDAQKHKTQGKRNPRLRA